MLTQYGTIPVRPRGDGGLEILLVTSRETRRWVVPRGNPMPGLAPHRAAAREAYEEAGVRGPVGEEEIGSYRYDKRRKDGSLVPARVHLYRLDAAELLDDWPERRERKRRWFAPDEAAAAVDEPELKALLLGVGGSDVWLSPGRFVKAPAAEQGNRMLRALRAIMPREERFFDLFASHSATVIGGADAMVRMFSGEQPIAESCREIADWEHKADDITRDVLLAVRRSFITPFDRSAITALISSLDDAVDEMWQTAKAIGLYEVETFEPQMREMAALSAEAARLVAEAIPLMRNIGKHGARLHQITEAIVHLEGRADDLHESGLKALFQAHGATAPMAFIVGREVYSHLERVLDRLEDVADEIQGIVIDHA